jgi:hypothetical protein
MKKSELRKLIRESIKELNEGPEMKICLPLGPLGQPQGSTADCKKCPGCGKGCDCRTVKVPQKNMPVSFEDLPFLSNSQEFDDELGEGLTAPIWGKTQKWCTRISWEEDGNLRAESCDAICDDKNPCDHCAGCAYCQCI